MKRGWKVLPFDGKKLQALRTNAGYKQPYVSMHTGIAIESLSRYENCKTVPSEKNCRRLAEFFGVPVDYFA